MKIILQRNGSEDNKLDKSLTTVMALTGELKEETSIIDPVITIKTNDASQLVTCNYMTIAEFSRKYFIKDIKWKSNDIWEITAHVDVLTSFKSEIKQQYALVQRQEIDYNLLLSDPCFKVYQNPKIVTKEFPSGFEGGSYILLIAGGCAYDNN